MNLKLSIFWSKGFLIGLVFLLVNDHFLKTEFHNWFTGKLSDIAGLFIFPLFIAAFIPKHKKHIYWITSIGFIWWKSSLSNGFIEVFNTLNLISITRVVDWTDLFALIIIPCSYYYLEGYRAPNFKLSPLPVVILTSVAFIATSQGPQKIEYYKEYSFQYNIDTLRKKVFFHQNISNFYRKEWLQFDSISRTPTELSSQSVEIRKKELENEFFKSPMWINVEDSTNKCSHINARISVTENRKLSKLTLYEFTIRNCPETVTDKNKLVEVFEKIIIKPLYESR